MDERFVSYDDFGAVGDGVTNDFFAMKAAHDYANEKGLPVRAGAQKTYLVSDTEIDGVAQQIIVKTSTDFCGSTVVIDDTDISWCENGSRKAFCTRIFSVVSNYEMVTVEQKYLDKINADGGIKIGETKKLEVGLGYPAMLIVYNDEERVYIRYGGNQDTGVPKQELVLIDAEGNIDESTPWLFDYKKLTRIEAYRADEPELLFENLYVLTKASQVNLVDQYHSIARGIEIKRSNTTIRNLEHKVINEIYRGALKDGVPFVGHSYGFMYVERATNILIEDTVFQARAYYLQGTYDFGASLANNLLLKNCRQRNFFSRDDYNRPELPAFGNWWGVAGTNGCKNMVYDGCKLTRYDAHCGVVNGAIKNSEISSIRLIGAGDMLIENCKIYLNHYSTLQLREDYGCTWRGTLTVKNCEYYDTIGEMNCFMIAQSANWNYGYTTYFPNIVIDNLKIPEKLKEVPILMEFPMKKTPSGYFFRSVRDENIAVAGAICADGKPNVNPYTPPEFIKVINNEKNGYEITVPDVPFFKDTKIEGAIKK